MDKQAIFNLVSEIVRRELGDTNMELSLASKPSSVDKWDSINNLSIINSIEEKFGITFSIDDIFHMESVDDICNCISKTQSSK